MGANDYQIGGEHYHSSIQHWDYVLANDIPYLEAMAIKYLTRWRDKGGHDDIRKAYHFVEKLMEHEGVEMHPPKPELTDQEIADLYEDKFRTQTATETRPGPAGTNRVSQAVSGVEVAIKRSDEKYDHLSKSAAKRLRTMKK